MNTTQLETDVRAILQQGGDPARYQQGLARRHSVSLDIVQHIITVVGSAPRVVDAETVAQERLRDEPVLARQYPRAWRTYNHEEE